MIDVDFFERIVFTRKENSYPILNAKVVLTVNVDTKFAIVNPFN